MSFLNKMKSWGGKNAEPDAAQHDNPFEDAFAQPSPDVAMGPAAAHSPRFCVRARSRLNDADRMSRKLQLQPHAVRCFDGALHRSCR